MDHIFPGRWLGLLHTAQEPLSLPVLTESYIPEIIIPYTLKSKGWQTFPIRQKVNIFSLEGQMVSVAATGVCGCHTKRAIKEYAQARLCARQWDFWEQAC